MERVFEVVVVLGDVLRDYIGGGAGSDHHGLEAASPRFQRENDLADIAGNHRIDVILGSGALEGANGFRRR